MPFETWALDASAANSEEVRTFVPIDMDTGEIFLGMSYIGMNPPGVLVGIIHHDGDEACEKWCKEHPEIVSELFGDGPEAA